MKALMWERNHKEGRNYIGREVRIIAETTKAYKVKYGMWEKWLPKYLYSGDDRFEIIKKIGGK